MGIISHFSFLTLFLIGVLIVNQDVASAEVVVYDLEAHYFDAAPDGVTKQVLGVNGQFPGPTIRAKIDDVLVIRVTNSIRDSDNVTYPTSVHWHGIEMFLTPFYDGPEAVTQCPIPCGQSMEYRFKLYQAGTYWYHSHHSWQYTEGFWGLLIIDNMPEIYQYDEELSISLTDWYHPSAQILSDMYHRQEIPIPVPDSGLINGRGEFNCENANGKECDPNNQDPSLLSVKAGKTYRIRVINTAALANYFFSIDGHRLTVIEVDGVDTVQVGPVDSVELWPAQRYSFLVTMNGTLDSYWIRSTPAFVPGVQIEYKAVLEYNRTESVTSESPRLSNLGRGHGTQGRPEKHTRINWKEVMRGQRRSRLQLQLELDSIANDCTVQPRKTLGQSENARVPIPITRLPITEPNPNPVFLDQHFCRPIGLPLAPNHYDEQILLNATFDTSTELIHYAMNGIIYQPHSPPVLMRILKDIPINSTSNPQYLPKLKRVIQVVINNEDLTPHPWHLHGHTFWVLGTGLEGSGNYDERRDRVKLRIDGVRRDTTMTPGRSWAVVRFETDNPGAWILHCHINWHPEIGLAVVFIEGEEELKTIYQIPNEAKRICALNGIDL